MRDLQHITSGSAPFVESNWRVQTESSGLHAKSAESISRHYSGSLIKPSLFAMLPTAASVRALHCVVGRVVVLQRDAECDACRVFREGTVHRRTTASMLKHSHRSDLYRSSVSYREIPNTRAMPVTVVVQTCDHSIFLGTSRCAFVRVIIWSCLVSAARASG